MVFLYVPPNFFVINDSMQMNICLKKKKACDTNTIKTIRQILFDILKEILFYQSQNLLRNVYTYLLFLWFTFIRWCDYNNILLFLHSSSIC